MVFLDFSHHRMVRAAQLGLAHPSYAGARPSPQNVNAQSSPGQMVPGILYTIPGSQPYQNRFDDGYGFPFQQFPPFSQFPQYPQFSQFPNFG